jgi:hypothetical protein
MSLFTAGIPTVTLPITSSHPVMVSSSPSSRQTPGMAKYPWRLRFASEDKYYCAARKDKQKAGGRDLELRGKG